MKHTCTHLVIKEDVQVSSVSVHRLEVEGFSVTKSTIRKDCHIRSRCKVDGRDFEIQFVTGPYSSPVDVDLYWVGLVLVYLGAPCDNVVAVDLRCRLRHDSDLLPLAQADTAATFKRPLDRSPPIYLGWGKVRDDVQIPAGRGKVRDDVQVPAGRGSSFTVECTIKMRSRRDPDSVSWPSSDLQKHLGELLQNQSGVDVTFVVSGESISAHKIILAARSPIFKAEFLGNMLERSSQCVEIQDMHPAVFKAMLHYIYTDKVPELDNSTKQLAEKDEKTVMAQHLLAAADRYGLDRLKEICEERLARGIDIDTVASTLVLAEQHNLTKLKAKCFNFISSGSSEALQGVLETEGYRHLEASYPSVLRELLKAVHGKKRKESMDS